MTAVPSQFNSNPEQEFFLNRFTQTRCFTAITLTDFYRCRVSNEFSLNLQHTLINKRSEFVKTVRTQKNVFANVHFIHISLAIEWNSSKSVKSILNFSLRNLGFM